MQNQNQSVFYKVIQREVQFTQAQLLIIIAGVPGEKP